MINIFFTDSFIITAVMKIDTGIASTIPILSTKKRHNSHGICNFTMVTKRTSLFIRIKHVGIRPQPNTNNSTLIIVPIMSYPISLPERKSSTNFTSGFCSTISLKATDIATATSMMAPSPDNRISAWKISSGLSILPRYSIVE